jgi:hypothetical protein
MMLRRRYELVLAVYINSRGFAFVAFEGSLAPLDWGVKEIRGRHQNARCLARFDLLLDRYEPAALVLQDMSPNGTRRGERIRALNTSMGEHAEERGVPIYAYSRADVRSAFGHLGVINKHDLAEVIAKHIPAFERYVPPPRKLWMSEDARMGLFDATALILTFFQSAAGGARRSI